MSTQKFRKTEKTGNSDQKSDQKSLRSLVLLSAGLDSTVNLYEAQRQTDVVRVLNFSYGQRAAESEWRAASQLCHDLKLPLERIELPFIARFGQSSLIDSELSVPQGKEVLMDDLDRSRKTAAAVWVPNRNGIFLSVAAGFAEALGADIVIPGFNIEEAQTFPDNSQEFMETMTESLRYSTANQVRVQCFTANLNKTQIVKRGIALGVPFGRIWPCYFSGELWCGECESCQRSRRAFIDAGLDWEKERARV